MHEFPVTSDKFCLHLHSCPGIFLACLLGFYGSVAKTVAPFFLYRRFHSMLLLFSCSLVLFFGSSSRFHSIIVAFVGKPLGGFSLHFKACYNFATASKAIFKLSTFTFDGPNKPNKGFSTCLSTSLFITDSCQPLALATRATCT